MPSKLLPLILLLALSKPVAAQPEKGQFEISGSIGIVSGRYLSESYDAGDMDLSIDRSETPNYFVSGKYFFTDRLAAGLTYGEQVIHGEYNTAIGNGGPYYTYKRANMTYAAEITFVYVTRPFIMIYLLGGIGYGASTQYTDYVDGTHTKQHNPIPTMQSTPLGFRFGGRLAGFVELGFGYKGLVNTGICYAIGRTQQSRGRAIR